MSQAQSREKYVVVTKKNGVLTCRMNRPKKLNGWTLEMMEAFVGTFEDAAKDDDVKALIFTGTGRYFSAGVNLAGTFSLKHPRELHRWIKEHNQHLFEVFLNFPKPILITVNGPAIGASVTSATLCDGIIAAEEATFSTPFGALYVPPEGCSSEVFPKLIGEDNAPKMLKEGWKPTAKEALEIGLVQWVVSGDDLLEKAQEIAEGWIEEGHTRSYPCDFSLDELKKINARESEELATAFLSPPFLSNQARFLWSKKKRIPSIMFKTLSALHPLWSRLI